MLETLDRLIGFETVSVDSNLDLIDYVQDLLLGWGFRVTRMTDPDMPKAGLYAEIGPQGFGVMLSAHTDVVPVAGQAWTQPAFALTREGDRLFGRGTTDMKGFVAAMLSAAKAASQMPLREPLKIVLSYDEELGCTGVATMMAQLAPLMGKPRFAIVGEPTQMQVATGHKGKQGFEAQITGQAGHSALAPRFVNALNVAADTIVALRALQDDIALHGIRDDAYDIPYSTLHVGILQGGTALNIVPDRAKMRFEFRHLAADPPEALRQRIDTALAEVVARHGAAARIQVTPLAAYPGLDTPLGAAVVTEVRNLAQTALTKVAFGTEAGFFDAQGIPTVVCGPGSMEGQGHKADEYIEVSQLLQCEAMLMRLLATMC